MTTYEEPISLAKRRIGPAPNVDADLELVELEPLVLVDVALEDEPATWHDVARGPAPKRAPVWAPWLRDAQARADVARYGRDFLLHRIKYHGIRLFTTYLGRALARTPRGVFRILRWAGRWVFDAEGSPARALAVGSDPALYDRMVGHRNDIVLTRLRIAGAVLFLLLATAVYLWWFAPRLYLVGTVLATIYALGKVGSSRDKPLIGRAVISSEAPRLDSDVIVRALCSLGIPGIKQAVDKDPNAITFPSSIMRDGKGWRAEIVLPYGVEATEIVEKRGRLAAGLRRPLGCVWPECNPDIHPGVLILWVGDQDIAKVKQPPWPLLRSGKVDLFEPIPFGVDQRGRPVGITLMFASMVIGALPRMGKTNSLRLLLVGAALDARAQLHVYDLKGTGDLAALAPVAHRYRCGDDDDDIEYMVNDLRELRTEQRRRTKVIRTLPAAVCPDNKVTPALASRRDYGLHPIVLGIDECQCAYEHPKHGKEIEEIVTDLVKRGPAVGIVTINATQRPDKDSLPTGISGNAILRWCLKVAGQVENDMILGTSSYRNGLRATVFPRSAMGVGYLAGEGEDAYVLRGAPLNAPGAISVITRAHGVRVAEDRLTGHALGYEPEREERPSFSLLADVLDCVKSTEAKVQSEVLCKALEELRPDVYMGWDATTLAKALKPFGVTTADVKRKVDGVWVNQKGVTVADVRSALAEDAE